MVTVKEKSRTFFDTNMFSRQNKTQCLALNVAKTFNRQALTSYWKSHQVALMKKVRRPSPHFSTLHWFEHVDQLLDLEHPTVQEIG